MLTDDYWSTHSVLSTIISIRRDKLLVVDNQGRRVIIRLLVCPVKRPSKTFSTEKIWVSVCIILMLCGSDKLQNQSRLVLRNQWRCVLHNYFTLNKELLKLTKSHKLIWHSGQCRADGNLWLQLYLFVFNYFLLENFSFTALDMVDAATCAVWCTPRQVSLWSIVIFAGPLGQLDLFEYRFRPKGLLRGQQKKNSWGWGVDCLSLFPFFNATFFPSFPAFCWSMPPG